MGGARQTNIPAQHRPRQASPNHGLLQPMDRLIAIESHLNVGEMLRKELSRRIHTELEAVENE